MTGSSKIVARLKLNNSGGANCGWRGSRSLLLSRRGMRGQELVEFALVIPVLALFVFGVLDVGRVFHVLIAISNAAREGARYGMSYGIIRAVNNVYSLDETVIDNAAVKEAANLALKLTPAQVTPTCQDDNDPDADTCASGARLRVVVTYNFRPFLLMVFPSIGLDLVRDMEMVIP